MITNELNQYITLNYETWMKYAARYINRSHLNMNPAEVVNDVLCTLLERDTERMQAMMDHATPEGTELDYFMMRIIKTSIYSPRSPIRYQRGQHCTRRIRRHEELPDNSHREQHRPVNDLVYEELQSLKAPDFEKQLFIWKFFDGNPISKWPGPESRRSLYHAYNRIIRQITQGVRGKIGF